MPQVPIAPLEDRIEQYGIDFAQIMSAYYKENKHVTETAEMAHKSKSYIVEELTVGYPSMINNGIQLLESEPLFKRYAKMFSVRLENLLHDVQEQKSIPTYSQPAQGDTFSIYQLKRGDETRNYRFEPLERLQAVGFAVERENYEHVYTGPLANEDTLDSIYMRFNTNHPEDFKGHSLSVSDIVTMSRNGKETAHYVDDIGFADMPSFMQGHQPAQEKETFAPAPKEQKNEAASKQAPVQKGIDRVQELTDQLEKGIQDLYASDKYKEYLNTMAKFYNYSFNNTLLIGMQRPDATQVAGFNAWDKNFGRHVKRGEKGIKILAPSPYKYKVSQPKIDPNTHLPIKGEDGKPVTEQTERTQMSFRVVTVFDVSQTEGKPLPEIAQELSGEVKDYTRFMDALKQVSPVPIAFEQIESASKGYYHQVEKRIAIREGMSEAQNVKTSIHEITHAMLHDRDAAKEKDIPPEQRKDSHTKEVEAESVAYVVCQHYGIDTSDYSFGYVAGWGSGKETKELKASLETIRETAAALINDINERFQAPEHDKAQQQSYKRPDTTHGPEAVIPSQPPMAMPVQEIGR